MTHAPPTNELLRIAQGAAPLTAAQKAFNRLTQQIADVRGRLALWQATTEQLRARAAAEIVPGWEALDGLHRQLVERIDALLSFPPAGLKLTARRREALTDFLLRQIDRLLATSADDALVALHDRYSDLSWHDRNRLDQSEDEDRLRDFLDAAGVETAADDSIDDLLQRARERMAAKEAEARQEHAAHAERHRAQRRETAADRRRAEEAKLVGQSVRDVYRKLVSSLHPDREADPDERERKTLLMKDINRAYQANDLLTLLSLQMQIEQIDASTLAGLPAQRLQHYNKVLREQQATLNGELRACIEELAHLVGAGHYGLRNPGDAELLFKQQLRELRSAQGQLRESIDALANPHLRLGEIDAIVAMVRRRR